MSFNELTIESHETYGAVIDGIVVDSEIRVIAPPKALWLGLSVVLAPLPRRHDAATRQLVGLRVSRVSAGSPAAQAGLREKDILLAIDGETATFRDALREALKHKRAGDAVNVGYLRRGVAMRAAIVLAPRREG